MGRRSPYRNTIDKSDIVKNAYDNILRGRSGQRYLMLLDILLFRNNATDWGSKPVVSEQAAIHHIFPREFLKDNEETRDYMINCLGNLTFISPSVNSEIGDEPPENYLAEYVKSDIKMLEQHFIPTNKKFWSVDRFEGFLDTRLNLIWKQTKELLDELQ